MVSVCGRIHVCSGQNLQTLFEAVNGKGFVAFAVIERVVCVEPIALGIHVKVGNLRRVRRFDQHLLLGNKSSNQLDFVIIEMELLLVKVPVHIRIGKEDLGDAALQDHIENVGLAQFVDRLCRKYERGVVLPPRLERFHDVGPYARILEKDPGFVDEERLEYVADVRIADDGIGAVQDVEEQGFQKLRILPHALKIETLEARKADCVLHVVEQKPELPTLLPLVQASIKITSQGVAERA